jgi:anti-anti-sigma regulatory factor
MSGISEPSWTLRGDQAVIRAPRYLNRQAGREIVRLARRLTEGDTPSLLLDLQASDLANHQGAGELFELRGLVAGGRLSVRGMSPTIAKLFNLMGFDAPAPDNSGSSPRPGPG